MSFFDRLFKKPRQDNKPAGAPLTTDHQEERRKRETEPVWKGGNQDMALKAVENEADPAKLYEIVKSAPLSEVRKAAVGRITDDAVLREVALNDANREVRKTALFRISREELLPLKDKGCPFFGMEHAWEQEEGCIDRCSLCGKSRTHHVWNQGVCLKCGASIAELPSVDSFRISDILNPAERGVVVNALAYALQNWGDSAEEEKIRALMTKCGNADVLNKADVILLIRTYRLIKQLFPNNQELNIDRMDLLDKLAQKM